MPLKEVSTLADLCLRNVATNVVHHGKNFSELSPNSEVYDLYKAVQFLFYDDIMEQIRQIYKSEVENVVVSKPDQTLTEISSFDHFIELTDFLLQGRVPNQTCFLWPSLQFIYNEFTNKVSLRFPLKFPSVRKIPNLFFDSLALCKNLKHLRLHLCRFHEVRLLQSCSWSSLVELDLLLSSCSDSIVTHAFKSCPDLQILKASGRKVTDRCFFELCEEWSLTNSENFQFCKSEGLCRTLGKKIKKLVVYGTKITVRGVTCALQHLSSMEEFLEGGLSYADADRHLVAHGVSELKRLCDLFQRSRPTLKLCTMVYDRFTDQYTLNDTRECCPFIYRQVFCKESEVSIFRCKKTQTLSLANTPDIQARMPLSSVISLLHEEPVKNFSIVGYVCFDIYGYGAFGRDFDLPAHIKHLERLSIINVTPTNTSFLRLVKRILCVATNLKSLSLHGFAASFCLMSAMEKNKLNSLEEVTIYYADLSTISFKDLIRRKTCLKEITYHGCENEERFVEDHMNFARKSNFHLNIYSAERNVTYGTVIKFDLI